MLKNNRKKFFSASIMIPNQIERNMAEEKDIRNFLKKKKKTMTLKTEY